MPSQIKTDILKWTKNLKDPNTNLYKLCKSAYHPFSIDACSLIMDLFYMLQYPLTKVELKKFQDFFKNNQDPNTGFFHEPFSKTSLNLSVNRIEEMSGTYFGYQVSSVLMAYNISPYYSFEFYKPFLTPGSFSNYMSTKMPWTYSPMGAGNMVDHAITMIRSNIKNGLDDYKIIIKEIYMWLDKHQNPDTGFWGNINSQGENGIIQAGYHILRGTYFTDNKTPKYIEKMIDTILHSLQTQLNKQPSYFEGCYDMDHFHTLQQLHIRRPKYRHSEIKKIAETRLSKILKFKRKDGAFSFETSGAITNHNRYNVSPGKIESDLVGTVFYLETIYRLNQILTLPVDWLSSASHGCLY